MKNKTNAIAAMMLALAITTATATMTAAQEEGASNANSIVGTWNSTVTFVDCTTGAVIRSFPTMNTFHRGGTMNETSRSMAQRSPGHGEWKRVEGHEYSSVFKIFRSNADGSDNGYQIIYRAHTLEDGTLNTTAVFQNYNAAGAPTTGGCALETATRLQ